MKLYDIHKLVEAELVNNPDARNSDITLYIAICNRLNPGVVDAFPFSYVMKNRADLGLPLFESVGRCRRKLQEHNALLRADPRVVDRRYRQWKEVRDYVKD